MTQRYNPEVLDTEHHTLEPADMILEDNGDFVHYSDYEKLVEALTKIANGTAFQQNFEGVCISDDRSVARDALKEANHA